MNIQIVRTRYVIVRDDNSIFCGLAQNYQFKSIGEIGDTAIKTYLSEKKAKSSFLNSWRHSSDKDFDTGKYKVVEVEERIMTY